MPDGDTHHEHRERQADDGLALCTGLAIASTTIAVAAAVALAILEEYDLVPAVATRAGTAVALLLAIVLVLLLLERRRDRRLTEGLAVAARETEAARLQLADRQRDTGTVVEMLVDETAAARVTATRIEGDTAGWRIQVTDALNEISHHLGIPEPIRVPAPRSDAAKVFEFGRRYEQGANGARYPHGVPDAN